MGKGALRRGTWLYFFQCVKAVLEEKDVNYSSHLLWMGLNLKEGKFGLNIKKSFLAISLLNEGTSWPEQGMEVLSLEVFVNQLFCLEWVRKSRSSLRGKEMD